ncbi:hypothetical protein QQP08_004619 [Theobroma cacao]|nr:hypothetical protein QQP08_004619 [Theobroma cacao]
MIDIPGSLTAATFHPRNYLSKDRIVHHRAKKLRVFTYPITCSPCSSRIGFSPVEDLQNPPSPAARLSRTLLGRFPFAFF